MQINIQHTNVGALKYKESLILEWRIFKIHGNFVLLSVSIEYIQYLSGLGLSHLESYIIKKLVEKQAYTQIATGNIW